MVTPTKVHRRAADSDKTTQQTASARGKGGALHGNTYIHSREISLGFQQGLKEKGVKREGCQVNIRQAG